ncbi:MAG TPA: MFS transporter [Mycobacteriales bacterium]|nr:MFS transporter [Mycobacteriales bacterium]
MRNVHGRRAPADGQETPAADDAADSPDDASPPPGKGVPPRSGGPAAGLGPAGHEAAPDSRATTAPRPPETRTRERPATYRDVFAVRAYRHLFLANVLSMTGDQLSKVALAVLVYTTTRSATLAAATFAVTFLPWVVGGPLLSSYADLLPRRRVLVGCDLARAVLVGALAIPHMPVPALIGILFLATLFSPPFSSARAAMMPDLLEGDRYVVANGLDALVRQLAQVTGFLVGGAAVLLITVRGALLADVATFLISALLILRGVPDLPAASTQKVRFNALRDTVAGVRIVFGDKVLRAYVALFWLASAFGYAYEGIAAPFAQALHGGPATVGMLLAAGPLGLALGAFLLARWVSPERRMRLIVPFAMLSMIALIPVVAVRSTGVVLVLIFLAGLGSGFSAPLNALFVRAVPAEFRGRAFGVAQAGVQALQGAAMLGAGLVVDRAGVGAGTVVGWCGIVGTVVVAGAAVLLWPRDDFHRGR